jgi:hypothetical protein
MRWGPVIVFFGVSLIIDAAVIYAGWSIWRSTVRPEAFTISQPLSE